ncbi:MAG: DUF2851 family protein [Bacteroidales bacterium]|nr:DUF2851 family protein [Bacteroidales bacterium]
MKEEFIHFIWKNSLYDEDNSCTESGTEVYVIDPGAYNRDSGPDFFNSRIRIGGTEWAGNVEIHINASDWYRHKHNLDHSYDNTILHVVVNNDREVKTASGHKPETFIISWDMLIEQRYNDFLVNPDVIACGSYLYLLPAFVKKHWMSRMAVERLEAKLDKLGEVLAQTGNDWDETFYRLLSRYFGLKTNAEPFYLLACQLPLKIVRKHADNREQVEALLFGQAGMLEPGAFESEIYDEYFIRLLKEYRVLRQKYSLKPIDHWMWKYHRLRPVNFPTIRISQLAGLLTSGRSLFSGLKSCSSVDELEKLFSCTASPYWNNHYTFGKYKRGKEKRSGKIISDLLLINTLIPLLFLYGRYTGKDKYCNRAVGLLDSISPENNRITRQWKDAGISASSALESQGLIHLRNEYCKNRRCLDCQYGSKLICLGRDIDPGKQYLLEEPGVKD